MSPAVVAMFAELMLLFAPPQQISVSQWADDNRVLGADVSAKAGRWRTRSYQREPMDACSDPSVYRVVVKASTQTLKTETWLNFLGWSIDVDPGPTMILCHRKEDANDLVDERIIPMLRDTAKLRGRVLGRRRTKKSYTGGYFVVLSGGSPSNVASRPVRYLIFEEVDKYVTSVGDEGNVVSLGRNRLGTFRPRDKEILSCSPTFEGSQIDRDYQLSDRREFYVACPHCQLEQSLMKKFRTQVKWDNALPTIEERAATAAYHCEGCGTPWTDEERATAVDNGRWVAHAPFNGIAGFWINALYTPRKISNVVLDWLQKLATGDQEELRTFVNTTLAENWAEQGDTPDWEALVQRRESWDDRIPRRALVLTAGADVHPDRIEVEIVGHGRDRERWSIAHHIFPGRTSDLKRVPGQPHTPWEQLEALMAEVYPHELGGDIVVSRLYVDSGNQTQDVYNWVRTQPPSLVVAIKGDEKGSLPVSEPHPVDVQVGIGGHKIKHGLRIRTVAGSIFKEQLYSALKKQPPTEDQMAAGMTYPAGFVHFPRTADHGDEYFRQLCAEQLLTVRDRKGRTRREWQQMRLRNEVLDCWVYALAAAYELGVDRYSEKHWSGLEWRLTADLFPDKQSTAGRPLAAPARRPMNIRLGGY